MTERQTGIKMGTDSPTARFAPPEGKLRRHSPRTEHRSFDSWPEMSTLRVLGKALFGLEK